ncbi:D-alanine--D-alanine ligase [Cochleicola gelatinilyticus]|uniref:D-alanine--D-alanine ligase n=1 Tax=Cochleicola gelatinilyticus TaxID=1763537 RepID=A0A167KBK9_9FLAO|nr:D-alanine--D-alanine ligase [Cochleicola gelatinilyticus]OAB81696.1 D-alanine--D-alanine ligase [Cochleicola gelatinilyticus]
MTKKNIAVAMGGYSSEFEISLQSGAVVCEALDKTKYNVFPIHILEEGWFFVAEDDSHHEINRSNFSFIWGDKTIVPDVVFNTIHGTPGEDGYLQAYLELLHIPQTSSGFYQAALSFNKRDCLSVLKNFGIKCANSYFVNQGNDIDASEIIKIVGLPCFVKPNRAGSSFGISKVYTIEELQPAIEKAFKEDSEILIETALVGTEVSVGAYSEHGKIHIFSPTEIVSENDFFDYEAKYLGKSEEITPARISEEITKKVQLEAERIYTLLNMSGVTRSEFIIQKGVPYFIETNTNPGLSKESIIPKQAREAGMTLTQFFSILIEEAVFKAKQP